MLGKWLQTYSRKLNVLWRSSPMRSNGCSVTVFCENEQDYIDAERIGRTGTRLARKSRPAMFQILRKYLTLRQQEGKFYDWDDIALHCRRELEEDRSPRVYKHIIVDEGQDFSPEMLRSLAFAVPEDGSLTFFGDVAQQIYGQRTSWRSAGLKISQAMGVCRKP